MSLLNACSMLPCLVSTLCSMYVCRLIDDGLPTYLDPFPGDCPWLHSQGAYFARKLVACACLAVGRVGDKRRVEPFCTTSSVNCRVGISFKI